MSEDRTRKNVFVRTLGNCVNELLYRQGVRFSKYKDHYYFRSTADLEERKVGGLSVFKAYESKTTPDRIAYFRHRAMKLHFLRFEQQWYTEITPSYHFTQDGSKLSRFFEERLKGIKQIEWQNKVHLRQIRLWEEVLRQEHIHSAFKTPTRRSLFSELDKTPSRPVEPYSLVFFGPLMNFDVEWGLPESA